MIAVRESSRMHKWPPRPTPRCRRGSQPSYVQPLAIDAFRGHSPPAQRANDRSSPSSGSRFMYACPFADGKTCPADTPPIAAQRRVIGHTWAAVNNRGHGPLSWSLERRNVRFPLPIVERVRVRGDSGLEATLIPTFPLRGRGGGKRRAGKVCSEESPGRTGKKTLRASPSARLGHAGGLWVLVAARARRALSPIGHFPSARHGVSNHQVEALDREGRPVVS